MTQLSLSHWFSPSQDEPDLWDALHFWYYATSNMYTHMMLFFDDMNGRTIHKICIPLHSDGFTDVEHQLYHDGTYVEAWYQ